VDWAPVSAEKFASGLQPASVLKVRYELHLQWKNLRFDDLIQIDDRLIERLASNARVDGHEIG